VEIAVQCKCDPAMRMIYSPSWRLQYRLQFMQLSSWCELSRSCWMKYRIGLDIVVNRSSPLIGFTTSILMAEVVRSPLIGLFSVRSSGSRRPTCSCRPNS